MFRDKLNFSIKYVIWTDHGTCMDLNEIIATSAHELASNCTEHLFSPGRFTEHAAAAVQRASIGTRASSVMNLGESGRDLMWVLMK